MLILSKIKAVTLKMIASVPDQRGIKFLMQIQSRFDDFVFGAIKIAEASRGSKHPKHRVTDFHSFFLENVSSADSVLDVGCAQGHLAKSLASKARFVKAIDIRTDSIDSAKRLFKIDNVVFEAVDFLQIKNERKYDVITMSNILEHIEDRDSFLRKGAALGNKMLIRVPAADRDWMVAYRKSLGLEWRLNKDHRLEYTEDILRDELKRADIEVVDLFCRWGNYCCVARPR